MNWKKIFIGLTISIIGIFLYLVTLFDASEEAFTLLFPLFLITHIVLSIVFVKKEYNKKILIIIIAIFLIHVFISQYEFPRCDSASKHGPLEKCDCFGLEKIGLFSSQCIGIRTHCYEYNRTLTRIENKTTYIDTPYEVSCS